MKLVKEVHTILQRMYYSIIFPNMPIITEKKPYKYWAYSVRTKEMNIVVNNVIKVITISKTVLINEKMSELL